jgi:hypothetical protein
MAEIVQEESEDQKKILLKRTLNTILQHQKMNGCFRIFKGVILS